VRPSGLVTTTSTAPAAWAGAIAVMSELLMNVAWVMTLPIVRIVSGWKAAPAIPIDVSTPAGPALG
jgi:hypothetical protein